MREHLFARDYNTDSLNSAITKAKVTNQIEQKYQYIEEEKSIEINSSDRIINRQLDVNSYNLEYAVFCNKDNCQKIYIGQIKQMLRSRVEEHRGSVSNKETDKATADHFNMPGHSLADLLVSVLEQTKGRGR